MAKRTDLTGENTDEENEENGEFPIVPAASIIGAVAEKAPTGWEMFGDIMGWLQTRRQRQESAKQFDARFAENQRQFGLNYALQEYATRKQLDLAEVKQMYENKLKSGQLANETALTREQLLTSAQARGQKEVLFDWERENKAKSDRARKSYAKGVLEGLSGRF